MPNEGTIPAVEPTLRIAPWPRSFIWRPKSMEDIVSVITLSSNMFATRSGERSTASPKQANPALLIKMSGNPSFS